jgi:hypothetical protein
MDKRFQKQKTNSVAHWSATVLKANRSSNRGKGVKKIIGASQKFNIAAAGLRHSRAPKKR